jgi:2,3-bisphosphoglycerate-independent phosphoglycerate mutase
VDNKIYSIEQIDGVVKTIAEGLKANGEDFSMLICPDHPTPISIMTHCSDPVPFVIYRSTDEKESGVMSYTEKTATKTGLSLDNGEQLMKTFLNK